MKLKLLTLVLFSILIENVCGQITEFVPRNFAYGSTLNCELSIMPSVLVKKNPYMVSQNYFAFELTKKKFTGYGLCKIQTPDVKNYAGSVGAIGAAFQISQRSFIYSDIDVSDFERNIVSRVGFNAIRRTQSNSFHIFNVRCEYQTNKRYETKRKNNFS
jgi:hypothetical protein